MNLGIVTLIDGGLTSKPASKLEGGELTQLSSLSHELTMKLMIVPLTRFCNVTEWFFTKAFISSLLPKF